LANGIAKSKGCVNVSANVKPNSEFKLIELKFAETRSEIWVDRESVNCVSDDNVLGGNKYQLDEYNYRYAAELFKYDSWDGPLLYGIDE
jgi:hypothetical protein